MAKKVRQVYDQEVMRKVKEDLPVVAGLIFSWQNPYANEKLGWRIWEPVRRDSELGQQVEKQLGDLFDKFQGLNEQTDYFMKGRDCMLSFASQERYDARQAEKQAKADAQLKMVETGAEIRHTRITDFPGRKD
jgi:acetolactate synthase small subunit